MEKKALNKTAQVFMGIGIGVLFNWLYYMFFTGASRINISIWVLVILAMMIPVALLIGVIKLIKSGAYKPLGISLLLLTLPLIVLSLVMGSCVIFSGALYPIV